MKQSSLLYSIIFVIQIFLLFVCVVLADGNNNNPDNKSQKIVLNYDMEDLEEKREKANENIKNRTGGKLVYIHPHKAGGSTMCSLASHNGFNIRPNHNCLPSFHDQPIGKQIPLFLNSDLEFMAIERMLLDTEWPLPGEFAYVITIRHPLDRVMSHYTHTLTNKPNLGKTFDDFILNHWENWAGNFYTKELSGCNGEDCTEEDLENAKLKLKALFSAVLISDNSEVYDLSSELLKVRFGFKNPDVNEYRKGTKQSSSAIDELKNHPEAFQKLVKSNQLDIRLWEYSRELFLEDMMTEFAANPKMLERVFKIFATAT